jgi:hypothetical protein
MLAGFMVAEVVVAVASTSPLGYVAQDVIGLFVTRRPAHAAFTTSQLIQIHVQLGLHVDQAPGDLQIHIRPVRIGFGFAGLPVRCLHVGARGGPVAYVRVLAGAGQVRAPGAAP